MVVPSPNSNFQTEIKIKEGNLGIPVIDLSSRNKKSQISELIVKACEEYGFFKVINHGVSMETINKMEKEALDFFAKPSFQKLNAGPPNPVGYGVKNIGFNGDKGEVEYLLLHTNPLSISQLSQSISNDSSNFSCVVNEYIKAVRNLACEILDLMAEGLRVHEKSVFSNFIRELDSDSMFRLNHYPSLIKDIKDSSNHNHIKKSNNRIGFGEHSDPQILTLLRSNDVDGLQISLDDGVWVPVPPDPAAFCVNVGDVLQALTNGRFVSVRHRALANSNKTRMSMIYFGAPSMHSWISPLPEFVTPQKPCLYCPFTWGEYKKAAYSLHLGDTRLNLFRARSNEELQNDGIMKYVK